MAKSPTRDAQELEVGGRLPALTLGSFLTDIASRHGEREAMVSGGRRTSYRALEVDSRRLARGLIRAGVVKGTHVAVLAGNGDDWVRALFAVGLVGGVLVPVNTFATLEERDYILRHSDASLLLLTPSLLKHSYLDDLLAAQEGALVEDLLRRDGRAARLLRVGHLEQLHQEVGHRGRLLRLEDRRPLRSLRDPAGAHRVQAERQGHQRRRAQHRGQDASPP